MIIYIYVNYMYNVFNVYIVHRWCVLYVVLCFLEPKVFLLILVYILDYFHACSVQFIQVIFSFIHTCKMVSFS